MKVIRETDNFVMNEGLGMANGLFNISDKQGVKLFLWFDKSSKDEFMEMTDTEFEEFAVTQVS